jgi:hypothetical protein
MKVLRGAERAGYHAFQLVVVDHQGERQGFRVCWPNPAGGLTTKGSDCWRNFGYISGGARPQKVARARPTGSTPMLITTDRGYYLVRENPQVSRDVGVDTRLCAAEGTRSTLECSYPVALLQEELWQMRQQAESRNGIQLTADNHVTWGVVATSLGIVSGAPDNALFKEFELHEPAAQGALATRPHIPETLCRERIRLTIRSHNEEMRRCYLEALGESPDLTGRLRVRFTILESGTVFDGRLSTDSEADIDSSGGGALASPDGDATGRGRVVPARGVLAAPSVVSSTLEHPGLEECVLGVIKSFAFPAQVGRMPVGITYPFSFIPTE